MIASGLLMKTDRSMPRDSCSFCDSVPRLVGINVATTTFKVRIIANMAKVRVERVTWEEISDGHSFSSICFLMELSWRCISKKYELHGPTPLEVVQFYSCFEISQCFSP